MRISSLFIFLIACLGTAPCLAQAVPPVVSIENDALRQYLDDSAYNPDDYSYTNMSRYCSGHFGKNDKPAPVTFQWEAVPSRSSVSLEVYEGGRDNGPLVRYRMEGDPGRFQVYNLTPGVTYRYLLIGTDGNRPGVFDSGFFYVDGRRRMIRAGTITNIRDFGGMTTTDGKRLVYGRLFRGAAMDNGRMGRRNYKLAPDGDAVLRDFLHIGADVDLRNDRELLLQDGRADNNMDNSPLGPSVEYHHCSIPDFGCITSPNKYGPAITAVVSSLEKGLNVYIHCAAGADRTGVLSFLLGAMAGVDENELARDYELTCFAHGGKASHSRNSTGAYNYAPSIDYIKRNFQGKTLSDKVCDYLVKRQGVIPEQITSLRRIMTDHSYVPTRRPGRNTYLGDGTGYTDSPEIPTLEIKPAPAERQEPEQEKKEPGKPPAMAPDPVGKKEEPSPFTTGTGNGFFGF